MDRRKAFGMLQPAGSGRTRPTTSLPQGPTDLALLRLIRSRDHSERDRDPIPSVDGHNRYRQVHQLRFREMLPHPFINRVRDVRVRNIGDGLGPFERRTFTIREERRLSPGAQSVQSLLGLPGRARVLGVHV